MKVFTLSLVISSLIIGILFLSQNTNAAKVDGPFMTEFVNDVSGADIFKVTVGLTNISNSTGLVELCVTANESSDELCHIIDTQKKYSHDFGNANCLSCIITIGTFIFPSDSVPVNSEVEACATKLGARQNVCDHTVNTMERLPEDIVLELK
jgi:hypothetical protein